MGKYQGYEQYKDSGVQWLGNIPQHWEVIKIQYIARLKSGENITSSQIENKGLYPVFGGNGLRGYFNLYTHSGHYILIGRQGALCGNINYANGQFWASEHAVVVNPLTNFNVVWLGELLKTMDLNQYSTSGAQPGLSVEQISRLKIPLPPLEEQKAIARFLDYKTKQIDDLISKQETLITKLNEKRTALITNAVTKGLDPTVPIKDSGVQWLGNIPEHWEVIKFKFLLSHPLKYGANEPAQVNDPSLPRYIRITDVKDDGFLKEDTFRSIPENIAKDYLLEESDILLARSGATVGKTFFYRKYWGKCAYAGYLIRARISQRNDSNFIYKFLQSKSYWDWVNSIFIQATIQNISAEKYASLSIPIPPLEEQN